MIEAVPFGAGVLTRQFGVSIGFETNCMPFFETPYLSDKQVCLAGTQQTAASRPEQAPTAECTYASKTCLAF
jgi:hypothetical protein